MRYLVPLFLFFPLLTFGQPVPTDKDRYKIIDTITERLKKNPHDDVLRWKRINLIFQYYTIDFNYIERCEEDTITRYSWKGGRNNSQKLSYKGIYIINELNRLIDSNATFILSNIDANEYDIYFELEKYIRDTVYVAPACLYFKRGQYYNSKGLDTIAIKDYLKALSYNPPKSLKESICYCIAANYYNRYKRHNERKIIDTENLENALMYIDMVTPNKYETTPRHISTYNGDEPDKFEKEKILLLKEAQKNDRLVGYLTNLTISWLNAQLENPSNNKYQSAVENTSRGQEYLSMLLEYVFALKDSEKIKKQFIEDIVKALSQK